MSRSSKLRIAKTFRRFVEVLPAIVLAAPAWAARVWIHGRQGVISS